MPSTTAEELNSKCTSSKSYSLCCWSASGVCAMHPNASGRSTANCDHPRHSNLIRNSTLNLSITVDDGRPAPRVGNCRSAVTMPNGCTLNAYCFALRRAASSFWTCMNCLTTDISFNCSGPFACYTSDSCSATPTIITIGARRQSDKGSITDLPPASFHWAGFFIGGYIETGF